MHEAPHLCVQSTANLTVIRITIVSAGVALVAFLPCQQGLLQVVDRVVGLCRVLDLWLRRLVAFTLNLDGLGVCIC